MTEKRFEFGKNWQNYLKEQNRQESYEKAKIALQNFLGTDTLVGKTFLDIGCGSGVHSLAAISMGASVVSIDVDKNSVACCESLARETDSSVWQVKEGSLLDEEFVKSLGTFDVVYCWGVAHHTGDMWTALKNLTYPLHTNSLLFIAIYNTVPGVFGSNTWHKIKKFYVSSPAFIQWCMGWLYYFLHITKILLHLKNPVTVFKQYRNKRGMSYKHDLIDWLGGFPYEYARVEELFDFYHKKYGMSLEKLKTTNFVGCNQLIFKK